MKRKKAILCALAGIGFITSAGTVKANAMTMTNNTNTTTKCIQKLNVDQVEKLLCELPYTINTNAKEQFKTTLQIIVSRMAYDSLSPKEQSRVDEDLVDALERDEKLLHTILGEEAKALGIVCGVVKLENQVGYDKETGEIKNKLEVQSNKEELLKLMKSLEDAYEKLDYSIKWSNGLPSFINELGQIEVKVASM